MVSGTLAPLYTIFGLKLGCNWLAGSESRLDGSEAFLAGSEACLAGSKACLAGSWALKGGNGRTYGRTDVRTYGHTDGKSPYSTGLRPLSGPLPRCSPTSTRKLYKAGQGYRWPYDASWRLVFSYRSAFSILQAQLATFVSIASRLSLESDGIVKMRQWRPACHFW